MRREAEIEGSARLGIVAAGKSKVPAARFDLPDSARTGNSPGAFKEL
jgi:hypothetical protein